MFKSMLFWHDFEICEFQNCAILTQHWIKAGGHAVQHRRVAPRLLAWPGQLLLVLCVCVRKRDRDRDRDRERQKERERERGGGMVCQRERQSCQATPDRKSESNVEATSLSKGFLVQTNDDCDGKFISDDPYWKGFSPNEVDYTIWSYEKQ